MRNRLAAILLSIGIVLAALLVPVTEAGPIQPTAQAQASFEIVENSYHSSRNMSVRIWEKGNPLPVDHIVGPNSGVNAGTDRISSYYIMRGTCANITRGGVPSGTKKGPDRVGIAEGERIRATVYAC